MLCILYRNNYKQVRKKIFLCHCLCFTYSKWQYKNSEWKIKYCHISVQHRLFYHINNYNQFCFILHNKNKILPHVFLQNNISSGLFKEFIQLVGAVLELETLMFGRCWGMELKAAPPEAMHHGPGLWVLSTVCPDSGRCWGTGLCWTTEATSVLSEHFSL